MKKNPLGNANDRSSVIHYSCINYGSTCSSLSTSSSGSGMRARAHRQLGHYAEKRKMKRIVLYVVWLQQRRRWQSSGNNSSAIDSTTRSIYPHHDALACQRDASNQRRAAGLHIQPSRDVGQYSERTDRANCRPCPALYRRLIMAPCRP